jgi:hypothetical protein
MTKGRQAEREAIVSQPSLKLIMEEREDPLARQRSLSNGVGSNSDGKPMIYFGMPKHVKVAASDA